MRHVAAAFAAFQSLTGTAGGNAPMLRIATLGLCAALMATAAMAADAGDAHKALLERFAPFDQQADSDGWESIAAEPVYSAVAVGKPEGAPMTLQPGAYKVVVLCDCAMMEVTLLKPDSTAVAPERSDEHGAMYSLDVPSAGAYLTGIDMNDCGSAKCDVGVKVYRKKSD